MTLDKIADQLMSWAWRGKHASKDNLRIIKHEDDGHPCVKLTILTVTNSYGIRAIPSKRDSGNIYMCCEFSAREPLPGETWTRGGDLSDGSFNEQTWNRIVQDILSVELAEAAKATA